MVHETLLQGGEVLDETGRRRSDVLIAGESVVAVAPTIASTPGQRVVDCSDCLIVPGLVDMQVHFREPGGESAETVDSGSRAAALGGVTAVVCMPNTTPSIDSPELVRLIRSLAAQSGLCDVHPSAAITMGRLGDQLVDMERLWEAGVRLFTDDGNAVMDSELMRRAFETSMRLPGAYLGQHAEDEALVAGGHMHEGAVARALGIRGRPAAAESIIVGRDLALAELVGARYHVLHASAEATVRLVADAKRRGVRVSAEVTPQHLVFTDEALAGGDALFKMNPPLREARDRDALRQGLVDGTIDAIATDHAPHPAERKRVHITEAAPGMTGLETMLASVLTALVHPGPLSLEAAIAAMSWKPARIAGLDRHGHGGPIVPGAVANLAVIAPDEAWRVDPFQLGSKSINNPFRGQTLRGRTRHTFLRGDAVVLASVAQR